MPCKVSVYERPQMMRVLTSGMGFVTLLITVLLLTLWNPAIGAKGNILHPEYFSEVLIEMEEKTASNSKETDTEDSPDKANSGS